MFSKKPDDTKSISDPPATGAAGPRQADPPKVDFRYVDRPDCLETFADTLSGLVFDGQSLRLEFAVSRLDERKPDAALSGRRYPVCRLVLPPAAAIDLINKMQQVAAALAQTGMVKAQGETPRQEPTA